MTGKSIRALVVAAAFGLVPSVTVADEIVHFANGAEMTVRSHVVEKDMVKLDLGNNSFIAFPMSMVDKIVNAGQDVFLNPTFHPANQAVAGSGAAPGAADTTIRGGGGNVGLVRQQNAKGGAGVMLGEAADVIPSATRANQNAEQPIVNQRRAYNPAFPAVPGGMPQTITPPSAPKAPTRMSFVMPRADPPPPPPADNGAPAEAPPQGDPNPPEDPPENR